VIDRYEQYNTTIADLGLMLPRTWQIIISSRANFCH
jgi:hypothetical protein